jgi:SAM-dependent methyltransferase
MQDGHQLDQHKEAYKPGFPHFEENRMVHEAYGKTVAHHIQTTRARTAMSLGIGHEEVARALLSTLTAGPLQHYLVVDGAPKLLNDFAQSVNPAPQGLELLQGFFETFHHKDVFDVIEAGFVLEHVDDPAFVLRRLHRFLAPGGRIFVAVPNARSLHRVFGHHAGFLPDMFALSPADLALGHRRYFDLATLTALVQDAGYTVAHTAGMLLKPFTTAQLSQLNLPPAVWRAMLEVSAMYPEISNSIYMELVA